MVRGYSCRARWWNKAADRYFGKEPPLPPWRQRKMEPHADHTAPSPVWVTSTKTRNIVLTPRIARGGMKHAPMTHMRVDPGAFIEQTHAYQRRSSAALPIGVRRRRRKKVILTGRAARLCKYCAPPACMFVKKQSRKQLAASLVACEEKLARFTRKVQQLERDLSEVNAMVVMGVAHEAQALSSSQATDPIPDITIIDPYGGTDAGQ